MASVPEDRVSRGCVVCRLDLIPPSGMQAMSSELGKATEYAFNLTFELSPRDLAQRAQHHILQVLGGNRDSGHLGRGMFALLAAMQIEDGGERPEFGEEADEDLEPHGYARMPDLGLRRVGEWAGRNVSERWYETGVPAAVALNEAMLAIHDYLAGGRSAEDHLAKACWHMALAQESIEVWCDLNE